MHIYNQQCIDWYHGGSVEEDWAVAEAREELLLGLAAVEDDGLVGALQHGGAVRRQEPCPDGVGVSGGPERRRDRGRVARVAGRGQRDGVRHALLRQPEYLRSAAVHAVWCGGAAESPALIT